MKANLKFTLNKKYFIGGLLLILIINRSIFFGGLTADSKTESNSVSTVKAQIGDVENSIDGVGNAELVDEQSLSFNKTGTITKIYFEEGESISKGDIIAQLDDSDGYDEIEQAKLNLENAKLNLQQLYDEVDDSKKLQAQNNIDSTKKSISIAEDELENLKISQNNSLEQSLQDIETLEKELENSKNSLEVSKEELTLLKKEKENNLSDTISNTNKTVKNLEALLTSEMVNIEEKIEDIDYILGYTEENEEKNDDFEEELSSKNTQILTNAEISFEKTLKLYNNVKNKIDNYEEGTISNLSSILSDLISCYNQLDETTKITYNALDNSSSTTNFTDSDIENKKSTMMNNRNNVQTKITSLTSSINSLDTLSDIDLIEQTNDNSISSKEESIKQTEVSIEKKELEITNAKKTYETTEKEYEIKLTSKQKELDNLEKTLEINEASYDELLEGPTDENVAKAKNSITQAELKLNTAYENLDDYKLEAPFDGVIRKIDYMVGDKINNDTNKSVYIENPNLLEISVMLDQVDIVKVEKGNKAIVTFDAYSDEEVDAKISSIDTTPTTSSGVVSYEVKLVLDDDDFDKKVLSGMTSDIEIIIESKKDVVVIKTSAITDKDDKKYVTLLKDGKQIKKEIETGISSDGMTEVTSGLEEGDEVVVTEFKATSTSSSQNSSGSLFGGGGSRGGGMGRTPK